jgi:hypothetical protein
MRKFIVFVLLLSVELTNAAITNPDTTVNVLPGLDTYILLRLTTADVVAGLNGEFDYDPAKFSSPSVFVFGYNAGFICQGNEVSPGHFRFVVYDDPTRPLDTVNPILSFRLVVANNLVPGSTSTATYSMAGASDPNGVSLPINMNGVVTLKTYQARNAASEWSIYD